MGTYWFISAFFVMLALGPFINILADNLSRRNTLIITGIIIWITFIWKILNPLTLQYFTDVNYFISIYMVGLVIRRYPDILPNMSFWKVAIIAITCFSICVIGTHLTRIPSHLIKELGYPSNLFIAGNGASPILSVIIGTAIFICMSQTKQPKQNLLGKTIIAISPATLGVYLIHENFIVKNIYGTSYSNFLNLFQSPEKLL